MPRKNKEPSWSKSKEKEKLYEDINSGEVAGMSTKEVYEMHDGIYKKFKYPNFRTNLRNLRNKVAKDRMAADKSKEAYDHDKSFFAKPRHTFAWKDSDQHKQLVKDIRDGSLDGMKPIEARNTRDEYKDLPFSVDEWRNLFWAEKRRFGKEQRLDELKEIIRMKNNKLFKQLIRYLAHDW